MDISDVRPFLVGEWQVHPRLNRLVRGDEEERLSPKFMQVLVCLAEASGGVVTRDELLDRVWTKTVVGEAVLTRAISQLRKALQVSEDDESTIETIPTVGYRLLLPVREIPSATETVQLKADSRPGQSTRTLMISSLVVVVIFLGWRFFPVSVGSAARVQLSQQPVTSLAGEEFDPVFSPDGQRIAFARVQELEEASDIFVISSDGSGPVQLTDSPTNESSPTFSSDGKFVAFVRCEFETGAAGLYSTSSSGDGVAQLLAEIRVPHCMETPQISWSPDGSAIAFSEPDSSFSSTAIYFLDLPSRSRRALTDPGPGITDRYPRFSPDGRRIAFTRGRENSGAAVQLQVQSVTGSGLLTLTDGTLDIEGFDWKRDGTRLIVASRGNLYEIDAVSAERTWVAAPGVDIVQPTVSRSDGRLLFVQSVYDVNIWGLDPRDLASARPLISSTRVDNDPRISPDGTRLSFISDRSGVCSVFVSDLDGSNALSLASFDENCFNIGDPHWSPDGLNISFEVTQDSNTDIFVVSTAGGPVRPIAPAPGEDYAAGWSSDGASLLISSDRSGQMEVWRVRLDGSSTKQITTDGGVAAAESRDGKWMYYFRPEESGLWRMPVSGGDPDRIVDDLADRDFRNWRLNVDNITYIRRGDSPNLVRFDLESSEKVVLAELPTSLYNCSRADLSPDGTFAVFAQVDRDEDDLVLLKNYH